MAKKNPSTGYGGKAGNINKTGWGEFNNHPRWGGGLIIESLEERCTMDPLPNLILQLNDLKVQFNAHVDEEGTIHDADVSAGAIATADATTEATAYVLANALKAAYTTHIALGNGAGHVNGADVTNTVAAADATTLATLVTLTEELVVDYEAHRVLITTTAHGTADSTNAVTESNYAGYTCTTAIFPAGSIGLGCNTYVYKGMATAVNFDVGVTGALTRFAENELDTTGKADQNLSVDEIDSAVALVLTPDVTPTSRDGVILAQIHYIRLQALTSGEL
jgi:hypothetical protein